MSINPEHPFLSYTYSPTLYRSCISGMLPSVAQGTYAVNAVVHFQATGASFWDLTGSDVNSCIPFFFYLLHIPNETLKINEFNLSGSQV